jgi:formylglycine-generating enzyme required for sulfatase activity
MKTSRKVGRLALTLAILGVGVAGFSQTAATTPPAAAASEPAAATTTPSVLKGPITFEPKKGDVFAEDLPSKPALTMVWIPGGKFKMGDDKTPAELVKIFGDNEKSYAKEYPLHDVELDGFWMGAYMVTNQQYKQFDPKHTNQRGADQELDAVPVLQVSWADANNFCDWLSKKSGKHYRLPTEAQYEYATRAGTTTLFPWGDDINGAVKYANVADAKCRQEYPAVLESSNKGKLTLFDFDDGYTYAAPVGQFKPNAWGLYDMIGNAYSWCSDYWGEDYYSKSPLRNPQGPETGTARMARTGAWMIHPSGSRSASRNFAAPKVRRPFLGFRVVISPSSDAADAAKADSAK